MNTDSRTNPFQLLTLRPLDRVIAAAANGEKHAIVKLNRSDEGRSLVSTHRLGPQLAIKSQQLGLEVPATWRQNLRTSAVRRILLNSALQEVGASLDREDIPWMILKGMGPAAHVYDQPECRPTSDLDVLISKSSLQAAIRSLETQGWRQHASEAEHSSFSGSVYNWKGLHSSGVLLELHFALWGPVDGDFPNSLFRTAVPFGGNHGKALASPPPETYVTAAAHLWNSATPRSLLDFLDLFLIAKDKNTSFVDGVVDLSRRHDLQLFVGLAAAITSELWHDESNRTIAQRLASTLRYPERALLRFCAGRPSADLHLGLLTSARLLSHRKSRTGWRSPVRFFIRKIRFW